MKADRILVPVDFSEHSVAALREAADLAKLLGSELHVVHFWEYPSYFGVPMAAPLPTPEATRLWELISKEARTQFDAFLEARRADGIELTRADSLPGDPRTDIPALAAERGVDLIVMGTHGRTNLSHLLLGSVAERVVRTAHCPVLTLRARSDGESEVTR